MLHRPLGDDLSHDPVSVVDALPALLFAHIGERDGQSLEARFPPIGDIAR